LDSVSVEARFRLGWALWNHSEVDKPSVADLAVGYGAQLLGIDAIAKDRGRKFKQHRDLLRESTHWLREAIAREPHHARAHYYLAKVLKGLGHKEESLAMAKKAAEIEPENTRFATLVQSYTSENRALPFEQSGQPGTDKMNWNDLVLAPKTKRELRQMQLMLEKPDLAKELGLDPPTGILLKGAP